MVSFDFSLERLARRMHETFSRMYSERRDVRDSIEDLKRKRECLERDPYCPEIFEELVVAVVTQGYYFKRFEERLRRGLRRLTSTYGVKGLLEGRGREELLELNYDELCRLLADVCDEMLNIAEALPEAEAKFRELRARERVLSDVKSILQSLIRAQRDVI